MFFFTKRNILGGYFDFPAAGHGLLRIDDDVIDYLSDLVFVDIT